MRVFLSDPTDFETWLSASVEEAFKLTRSYAADQLRVLNQGQSARICWGGLNNIVSPTAAQAPC